MRPQRLTTASTSGGDVGFLRHVGDAAERAAAGLLDCERDAVGAALVEIDHGDLGAFGRQNLCDVFADIAPGAGDDRHLIRKFHRHDPAEKAMNRCRDRT